jgi:hypothetical protein
MATGTIIYWNGASGWIKLLGVEDLPTLEARDVMVLASDISSGEVVQGSVVSLTVEADREPWLAREVTVT